MDVIHCIDLILCSDIIPLSRFVCFNPQVTWQAVATGTK